MAFKMKNPILKKGNVKGNYKGGAMPMVSPMKDDKNKTSTIDKIKAAGKAFVAGAKETHGGLQTAMSTYKNEKQKARARAAKKK
tara:strand:+ start:209 stop:460 length:252 start_codon:yes stop_codon:yes gene_type:complete